MLREDSSSITPDRGFNSNAGSAQNGANQGNSSRTGGVDIQRELNRLEEMILDSPRLLGRTIINEDQLLEQLDLVRLNLPEAFHEAEEIVRHKEEILDQAEQYAQEMIEQAERRAAQILNETGIIRQAEMEAQQVRQQVHQECELAKEQTIAEIERMRRQAQQELEEMRRLAIAECEEIQMGADDYADRVLTDMEAQLSEMLRVIRNGRQQLQPPTPEPPRSRDLGSGSTGRSSQSMKGDRFK
jgi:F0F1-type ATP synthase membrane subunit b/b'